MKNDPDTKKGQVIEALPNLEYRIQTDDQKIYRCYMSGKMKINKIKILIGDWVLFVYPPGSSVGRVIKRI